MLINLEPRMRRHGFTRCVRALAITPAEVFGVCTTKSLDIIHAEDDRSPSIHAPLESPPPDPYRHDQFVFSYLLTDIDFRNSNWMQMARRITAWISVLFGKVVSEHELLQINTSILVPREIKKEKILNRELPFYSNESRVDETVELNFEALSALEDIVFNSSENAMNLHSAAQFYADALRWWVRDPEQSYVSLVTAGECLCGLNKYQWEYLADDNTKSIYQALKDVDKTGKLSRVYKSQTRFIREQFTRTLIDDIPQSIFDTSEYAVDDSCRLTSDSIRRAVKSAYDLRSNYVHTGAAFGVYTSIVAARAKGEIWHNFAKSAAPLGQSEAIGAVSSDMLKIIEKAATFIGLERIVRSAILRHMKRYMHEFVAQNSQRFTGPLPADSSVLAGRWVRTGRIPT